MDMNKILDNLFHSVSIERQIFIEKAALENKGLSGSVVVKPFSIGSKRCEFESSDQIDLFDTEVVMIKIT